MLSARSIVARAVAKEVIQMSDFTILARLRFRRMDEGGLKLSFRTRDFLTGEQYQIGYPMNIDGEYFDFRVWRPPAFIELGRTYDLMLKFLSHSQVSQRIAIGKKFTVWYRRTIADGVVLKIGSLGLETRLELPLEKPNFYLLANLNGSGKELKACFLRYSTTPHGKDCVCGIYVQDVDPDGMPAVRSGNRQEMTLYCPVDALDCHAAWPRLGARISANKSNDIGGCEVSFQEEVLLFGDADSAMDYARQHRVGSNVLEGRMDVSLVLTSANQIINESDLCDLVAGT